MANTIKNPARSRPLSANVRRLMLMERESPQNPNVLKASRPFTEQDIVYCEMQGDIFMAAIDHGISMEEFAPMFMTSQLAGVVDYSFSCVKGMETDAVASLLQMPILMKSPDVIVDVTLWLDKLVRELDEQSFSSPSVIQACISDPTQSVPSSLMLPKKISEERTKEYEYAYWLGYIYRCECLLHEESSRMVYGAFNEKFMRTMYDQMMQSNTDSTTLSQSAIEICRRLDMLLIGKLWKKDAQETQITQNI